MVLKFSELKVGDQIKIAGKTGKIKEIEFSEIGKQGTKKVRAVLEVDGEKVVMVRPADYPVEKI